MSTVVRLAFVCLLAALAALPGDSLAAAERPNVLIVMSDDQGSGDFSAAGNPVLKTPNLDAAAVRQGATIPFPPAPRSPR